jgi:hypothetical protein
MPEGVVSSALLEVPLGAVPCPRGEGLAEGRSLTLEQRLETAWGCAQQAGVVECPVCRAAMLAEAAGARCGACGSFLS